MNGGEFASLCQINPELREAIKNACSFDGFKHLLTVAGGLTGSRLGNLSTAPGFVGKAVEAGRKPVITPEHFSKVHIWCLRPGVCLLLIMMVNGKEVAFDAYNKHNDLIFSNRCAGASALTRAIGDCLKIF